jgi:hypothetical protein
MLTKRNAVLLCMGIGVSVVLALQWDNNYLAQLRARHVKRTILVSAANRSLAGFFDGLRPDPHWNAKEIAQSARQVPRCGAAGGGGLVARLLSIFERTAHAQGNCSGSCGGCYVNLTSSPCGTGCSNYNAAGNLGTNPFAGSYYDGSPTCVGTGCATTCNVQGCTNNNCDDGGGGGGCTGPGGSCSQDSDCCSGDCSGGQCQDTEVRRGL